MKKKKPHRILTSTLEAETLEIMKILDRTEEYADCLLWTGSTDANGYPTYKPYGCPCTLVRRAMFELNGGVLERRVPIEVTCGEKRCLNPKHLKASTCSAIGKKAGAKGAWSGVSRASKIASFKRANSSKLTIDDARAIRLSDETGPVLAAKYGVDRSLINGIKAGTRWRDYHNPFAGLMR